MTRWTLRHASRVISVSTDLLRRSTELGCSPERAVFLTNGVDPDKFAVRDKAECRQQLGLPQDRKIGVCVGYLIDRKDQSLLVRAVADIRNGGDSPPLIILVGDGPNRQRLQDEIAQLGLEKDVMLAGQRPHAEVAAWMGAADWLLLCSSSEGWATVYFEAMACGRPVLTSNVSSAKDAICQSAYGTVVEPRTPQAFAQAIQDAARRDFAPATLRAYAEGNSWQLWAQRAMGVFEAASADTKP